MSESSPIVVRENNPCAVLREQEEWGIRTYDLAYPPRRLWADQENLPPAVEPGVDAARVRSLPTPASIVTTLPEGDTWSAQSKRSLARLFAHYLICEDPQRRLDAREVITLSHQVSLVRHILDHDHLRRVMIADEVGLGKTVEAGLLIQELFAINAGLRVLYLAPARLVNNVGKEFDRLGLHFRLWKAGEADATLPWVPGAKWKNGGPKPRAARRPTIRPGPRSPRSTPKKPPARSLNFRNASPP